MRALILLYFLNLYDIFIVYKFIVMYHIKLFIFGSVVSKIFIYGGNKDLTITSTTLLRLLILDQQMRNISRYHIF